MTKTTKIFLLKGKKPNEYLITRLNSLFSYETCHPDFGRKLKEQIHDSEVVFTVAPEIETCDGHYIARNTNTKLRDQGFVCIGVIGVFHNSKDLSEKVYKLAREIAVKLSKRPGFYGDEYEFKDATDEWWKG